MQKQKDEIQKWEICGGEALVTIARTTNLVKKAMKIHSLSATTSAVLGRCLTMSALMGTKLSHKDANITSIIDGDGPAGKITCVAKTGCLVKGYMQNPEIDLYPNAQGKLDVSGAVGKTGKLRVVMDLGFGSPYTGEVNLVSGEIAEDFTAYYATSLQQPCAIALGVLVSPKKECLCSAGMLIELFPDASEETISTIEKQVQTIKDFSKQIYDKTLDEFVLGLFSDAIKAEYSVEPKYSCKCSKNKLIKVLKGMAKNSSIDDLFNQDGKIEAHCDFCNKYMYITKEDLQ